MFEYTDNDNSNSMSKEEERIRYILTFLYKTLMDNNTDLYFKVKEKYNIHLKDHFIFFTKDIVLKIFEAALYNKNYEIAKDIMDECEFDIDYYRMNMLRAVEEYDYLSPGDIVIYKHNYTIVSNIGLIIDKGENENEYKIYFLYGNKEIIVNRNDFTIILYEHDDPFKMTMKYNILDKYIKIAKEKGIEKPIYTIYKNFLEMIGDVNY